RGRQELTLRHLLSVAAALDWHEQRRRWRKLRHVCGSLDPWLKSQTRVAEKRYQELGGRVTGIIKGREGAYSLACGARRMITRHYSLSTSKITPSPPSPPPRRRTAPEKKEIA